MDDAAKGPPRGLEKEMLDAKEILNDIILKFASRNTEKIKKKFLELDLEKQKEILKEYGLKQSLLSRGFRSFQKRVGWRTNKNSRIAPKFSDAQNLYFKDILKREYERFVLGMIKFRGKEPYESLEKILKFYDMYQSDSRMIDNPKAKIHEWLYILSREREFSDVSQWAFDTYFDGEPLPQKIDDTLQAEAMERERAQQAAETYQRAAKWQGIELTLEQAHRALKEDKAHEEAWRRREEAARAREKAMIPAESEHGPEAAMAAAATAREAKFKADMAKLKGLDPETARKAAWKLQKEAAEAAAADMATYKAALGAAASVGAAESEHGPEESLLRAAPHFGPGSEIDESDYGGGSRRKSQRRKRGRKARRTRRH
jgi:hypothetical protein